MDSLSCIHEGLGLNGESCSTMKQQKSASAAAAVLLFWCAPGLDGPRYQSDFCRCLLSLKVKPSVLFFLVLYLNLSVSFSACPLRIRKGIKLCMFCGGRILSIHGCTLLRQGHGDLDGPRCRRIGSPQRQRAIYLLQWWMTKNLQLKHVCVCTVLFTDASEN